MIVLAAHVGYQQVSVAQISGQAGVSRATFYEQFEDKEDCLLAAYQTAAERLLAQALPLPIDGEWAGAAVGALRQLMSAIRADPDAGRLLFVERLPGGPRARETRRIVRNAFERRVQEFIASTPPGAERLDVPPIALVGAMRSILARYLRTHGEDELPALAQDAVLWIGSYAVPAGREPWSTSADALLPPAPATQHQPASGREVRRLPRGRHGLPAAVIARSQRTRIISGTAEVTKAKGYENATAADIVAAAGVSREIFYENFSDKQAAFLEAQSHPTQHILDACGAAYFSAADWPERVWNMLSVLLRMVAENPALSHLRLVECYAAGPDAIRRAEEITRSFTFFLEEGYSYSPRPVQLPRLCSHAITGAIFEIIQRRVARGDFAGLVRHLPQLTYIAIAPFIGPEDAVATLRQRTAGSTTTPLHAAGH